MSWLNSALFALTLLFQNHHFYFFYLLVLRYCLVRLSNLLLSNILTQIWINCNTFRPIIMILPPPCSIVGMWFRQWWCPFWFKYETLFKEWNFYFICPQKIVPLVLWSNLMVFYKFKDMMQSSYILIFIYLDVMQ